MWVVIPLTACESSTTPDPPATAETGATPSTPPAPDPVDARELGPAVQSALDWLPKLAMFPCYASWTAASDDRSEACPRFTSTSDPYLWESNSGCSTPDGSTYFGILTTEVDQRLYVETALWPLMVELGPSVSETFAPSPWFTGSTGGLALDGSVWLRTGSAVVPPDTRFELGGKFRSVEAISGSLTLRRHELEGLCHGGVPPAGSWVDVELDPWLRLTQVSETGTDRFQTLVDGSITGLPGPFGTIAFADVRWTDPALGGCAAEPDGTITVRRDDGVAVALAFDAASCDGCAEPIPTVGGAEVTGGGSVCIDAAPLGRALHWEEVAP
jgi:hypothetical protein